MNKTLHETPYQFISIGYKSSHPNSKIVYTDKTNGIHIFRIDVHDYYQKEEPKKPIEKN